MTQPADESVSSASAGGSVVFAAVNDMLPEINPRGSWASASYIAMNPQTTAYLFILLGMLLNAVALACAEAFAPDARHRCLVPGRDLHVCLVDPACGQPGLSVVAARFTAQRGCCGRPLIPVCGACAPLLRQENGMAVDDCPSSPDSAFAHVVSVLSIRGGTYHRGFRRTGHAECVRRLATDRGALGPWERAARFFALAGWGAIVIAFALRAGLSTAYSASLSASTTNFEKHHRLSADPYRDADRQYRDDPRADHDDRAAPTMSVKRRCTRCAKPPSIFRNWRATTR